jgi:alkaline phosphatase D
MDPDSIQQWSRRRFFTAGVGGLGSLLFAESLRAESGTTTAPAAQKPRFSSHPFTLGVASGEPAPDGVVLWTRLAPDPLNGGGMPAHDIAVKWRVARDEKMRNVVQSGTALARAALGHSVHVELTGLEPARWYWYQFSAGGVDSPVGRTRTAPAASASPQKMAFAFASCQSYQGGYYTAFQHMAREDLDLVMHLGDYIYEGGISLDALRRHNSPEVATLEAYRNRYALYKSDPHLQAAHAAFPWVVTWDDHEVENNYAGLIRDNQNPPGDFRARRAAAYQAYYEHLPLRRSSLPVGAGMQLYRRLTFGNLAEFNVLDTRQYRTRQPSNERRGAAGNTLLGSRQEQWLTGGLHRSRARWNVLAQQVFLAQRDLAEGPEHRFSTDAWDGYVAARDRLLRFLGQRQPANPIVLTGDVHNNWVADLKENFDDPRSRILGTEFVGTSISSGGDGADTTPGGTRVLAENPHIKFFNGQRGYVRCILTPGSWRSDYRVVPVVSRPNGSITTRASFLVENGRPGAQRV